MWKTSTPSWLVTWSRKVTTPCAGFVVSRRETTSTSVRIVSPGRTGARKRPFSTATRPTIVSRNRLSVMAVEIAMIMALGTMRPP